MWLKSELRFRNQACSLLTYILLQFVVHSSSVVFRVVFKSRVSEMPFPALWGQNLQNSNGQKTTYNMSKFTCSLNRIIFQNVITGAVFVVNTLCNWFLIILTTPTLHEKAANLTMQVYLLRDIYYSSILENAPYTITSIY